MNNNYSLVIENQSFFGETSLKEYISYDTLPGIQFINCNFEKVHLVGKTFGSCSFENCTITNADITRGDFYDTHFNNCEFLAVDLAASNLNFIGVYDVKVWESKEWVELSTFLSFEKYTDE